MYHRWSDTRERDLFLPTCGRSKFSCSNIMGLSLYVTIFKIIIIILFIYFFLCWHSFECQLSEKLLYP